eukprot:8497194-Karenia_brevis.AAC.1
MPSSWDNYTSAVENVKAVEAMFEEDIELGHMRKLTDAEADREFGPYHTAAIGALEKSDDTFRIIHDGTHGVRVNLEIVTRDQVAYPTVAEKTLVLTRAASR